MITMQAFNYGKVLYSLNISEEVITSTKDIIKHNNYLLEVLANQAIMMTEKENVISKIFHKKIAPFIKLLCENNVILLINDILEVYDQLLLEERNAVEAKLYYVTKPDEAEITQIKDMICNKYNKDKVYLELIEDKTLIGGIVLCTGNIEYDRSVKGNLLELQKKLSRR